MKISYLSIAIALAVLSANNTALAGVYMDGENIYKGQRGDPATYTQGIYIDVGTGASFIEDESTSNSSGRIATSSDAKILGRGEIGGFISDFRGGLEYTYRTYDFDSKAFNGSGTLVSTLNRTVDIHTGMLNGYYDIPTGTLLKPYLGVGVGAAYISGTTSNDETFFAAQGIAGLELVLDTSVSLYADYRYTYIDAEYQVTAGGIGSNNTELSSSNATAGLRFRF